MWAVLLKAPTDMDKVASASIMDVPPYGWAEVTLSSLKPLHQVILSENQ